MIIPKMGTRQTRSNREAPASALADALFTPVQQRVLGLLFGQPDRRLQSAELIRLAGAGTGAVHRVVTRLADAGLVTTASVGNQKYYQANAASPVFDELTGFMRKTVGLVSPLRDALEPIADEIDCAFVYGSIAKGTDKAGSDIDLMVIADRLDYAALYRELPDAESVLARPINPTVMTRKSWRRKIDDDDGFASRIAKQPKLFVIGDEHDLD